MFFTIPLKNKFSNIDALHESLAMQNNYGIRLRHNNNIHADILIKSVKLFELYFHTLFLFEFPLLFI